MKTIGLIGGMSWESTMEYYRIVNLTPTVPFRAPNTPLFHKLY